MAQPKQDTVTKRRARVKELLLRDIGGREMTQRLIDEGFVKLHGGMTFDRAWATLRKDVQYVNDEIAQKRDELSVIALGEQEKYERRLLAIADLALSRFVQDTEVVKKTTGTSGLGMPINTEAVTRETKIYFEALSIARECYRSVARVKGIAVDGVKGAGDDETDPLDHAHFHGLGDEEPEDRERPN